MLDNIIGVEEAAKILNISPGTVKNKCAAGDLPAKKIGKTWIMDKNQLEEWKMSKYNQLNQFNSTIIKWEETELRTIGNPYLGDDNETYRAIAVDAENNEYEVIWEINHPDFENLTDESEACSWESPIRVTEI
ncbi:helix-turn-helix domain-containing protein [Metabacillus sp. 84]|uniref:helix-turn-helix domain-containing protein n=1 Tax=Metabacillus sp. 84 TaxID=3404705 RepID=UPI003CF15381